MKMKQLNEDNRRTDSIEKRKSEYERRQNEENKRETKRIEGAKNKKPK